MNSTNCPCDEAKPNFKDNKKYVKYMKCKACIQKDMVKFTLHLNF